MANIRQTEAMKSRHAAIEAWQAQERRWAATFCREPRTKWDRAYSDAEHTKEQNHEIGSRPPRDEIP